MVGDAVAVGGGVPVDVTVGRGVLVVTAVAFAKAVAVDVEVGLGDGETVTVTKVGVVVCMEAVSKTWPRASASVCGDRGGTDTSTNSDSTVSAVTNTHSARVIEAIACLSLILDPSPAHSHSPIDARTEPQRGAVCSTQAGIVIGPWSIVRF